MRTFKLPERVHDNGDSVDFEKLLGPVVTEARTFAAGDDNRDVHLVRLRCHLCASWRGALFLRGAADAGRRRCHPFLVLSQYGRTIFFLPAVFGSLVTRRARSFPSNGAPYSTTPPY